MLRLLLFCWKKGARRGARRAIRLIIACVFEQHWNAQTIKTLQTPLILYIYFQHVKSMFRWGNNWLYDRSEKRTGTQNSNIPLDVVQKRRPDNKINNIPLDVVQNPSSRQNHDANGRRRATIPKRATHATAATGDLQNRILKVIIRVHGFGACTLALVRFPWGRDEIESVLQNVVFLEFWIIFATCPRNDDLSLCFLLFYDTNALEPHNGDFGHQLWGGRIPILHWTSNKKTTFSEVKKVCKARLCF